MNLGVATSSTRIGLLVLTTCLSLPAQPSFRISMPTNGTVFLQPTNVPLSIPLSADMSPVDYGASVEFYGDGQFLGSAGWRQQFTLIWSNLALGTHTVMAQLRLSGGAMFPATPVQFQVAYGGYALVKPGSVWLYRDGGVNLGTSWRGTDVDVSEWPQGMAKFGFGNDDDVTVLNWMNPTNGLVFPTYYFRHRFTVADPSVNSNLAVQLKRDDGAIVYLNGEELYRENMPPGEVDYWTPASLPDSYDGWIFYQRWIPPTKLRPDANVIAVEIHNYSPVNHDVAFDFALIGNIPMPPPRLTLEPSGTNVTLSWPTTYAGYELQTAESLGPGSQWQPVTNPPQAYPSTFMIERRLDEGPRFFRLSLE